MVRKTIETNALNVVKGFALLTTKTKTFETVASRAVTIATTYT